MIIKGMLGRYARWNPVHPTAGAFWGVGVGLGCGVGWGPGFGPEVIGYVGAGCGVGFSVGITLAGVGIGLPVNEHFVVPVKGEFSMRGGWNTVAPAISNWQKKTAETMSNSVAGIGDQFFSSKGRP